MKVLKKVILSPVGWLWPSCLQIFLFFGGSNWSVAKNVQLYIQIKYKGLENLNFKKILCYKHSFISKLNVIRKLFIEIMQYFHF